MEKLSEIEISENKLKELKQWNDEKYCLEAVKQDGDSLQYVKEQTEAMCLEAVKQDSDSLKYVKEQTEAICLEAVKQDGNSLQYVKEQTEAICLEAVKQDSYSLKYFDMQFIVMLKVKRQVTKECCDSCGQELP